MRVFELAKQLGKTSKDLLADLAKEGTVLKNHMSVIEDDVVEALLKKLSPKKEASTAAPKRGHVLIKKRAQPEAAAPEVSVEPGVAPAQEVAPPPPMPARPGPEVFRPHAPVVVPQPPPEPVRPAAAAPAAPVSAPRGPVTGDVGGKEREKERERLKKLKKGVKRDKGDEAAAVPLQQDALVWQDFKPLHRRDERLRAQLPLSAPNW